MTDSIGTPSNHAIAWRRTRLDSVDCLRGLAVACMIVVNNPGDPLYVYPQLRHAAWNGLTLADGVFPVFLFLLGVCVPLAVNRDTVLAGKADRFWNKALRRTGILFGLGLLENAYLHLSVADLRLPGVLQRIALVYLAAAWLHVRLRNRGLVATIAGILLGYWLLLAFTPVPGLGHPNLEADANLEGWLDQLLLRHHIWHQGTTWDPEGVLSTFPAIALGLIGVLGGRWLRASGQGVPRGMAVGLILLLMGLVWSPWFPINKSICSSSFVLCVGGAGIALLAAGHWLLDGRGQLAWARPLVILGTNPLSLYVAASFLASTLRHIRLADGLGGQTSLQAYLFRALFSDWTNGALASLAWAVLFLLPLFLCAWALFARRIIIKL
jgi:predicted acyltransferase